MKETEPQNVRIARILGWTWQSMTADSGYCITRADGSTMLCLTFPDFANDAAFILRMIDEKHLSKTSYIHENKITVRVWNAFMGRPLCEGDGDDTAHAVLAWIEAAHAAGIEVRK